MLHFSDGVVSFLYDLGGNSLVSGVGFIPNDGHSGKLIQLHCLPILTLYKQMVRF